MANPSSSYSSSWISTFVTILIILQGLSTYPIHAHECFTSIISFGDSLADTGNLKRLSSLPNQYQSLHFFLPPYGDTFFHTPTGRCSNGRLIIDFIAESMRMPLVRPFVSGKGGHMEEIRLGVNYAVAGATALDSSFLGAKGVHNPMTNSSLGVQFGWFKRSLSSICDNFPDCSGLIGQSLFLVGEIGGNDYNHALQARKSINQIKTFVPLVVETIVSTVNELIELGAKTLVIPGNLPIGCSPVYLTMHYGSNTSKYDTSTGCLIELNEFAEYHNELLQTRLNEIRDFHPYTNIIYADYYNAAMQFYRAPDKYGFTNGALTACCGGGGPFNYNASMPCAHPSSRVCVRPDTYANWDGLHLSEVAYSLIYTSLFQGPYTIPRFDKVCPPIMLPRESYVSK